MLIPPHPSSAKEPNHRHILYRNLVRECGASRELRSGGNLYRRTAYFSGTPTGDRARYNKLAEHVEEAAADLFYPESARFFLKAPPRFGDRFLTQLDAARDDFNEFFATSGAGETYALGVKWAHVNPSSVFKLVLHRNEPKLMLVPAPADIGVLHEEEDDFDSSDAICHWYTMTVPDYERWIRATIGPVNPQRAEHLIRLGRESQETIGDRMGDAMPSGYQVIISAATPTAIGNVAGIPDLMASLDPQTQAPVIKIAELWVFDDHAHEIDGRPVGEYRVVRMLLPDEEVIFEDLNRLNPGEHAFHLLALEPTPGYVWGNAAFDRLIPLQEWHEQLIRDIRMLFALNIDAPLSALGVMGITDEKLEKLKAPGGILTSPASGGEIKRQSPPLPPDVFTWLDSISRMFAQQAGRPNAMRGMGDPSSRNAEQDVARALLQSGPSLNRAKIVGARISEIATSMWRIRRRTYPHALHEAPTKDNRDGAKFTLMDLPSECVAHVKPHASPVYAQQIMAKVQLLGKDLDLDTKIELLDLPLEQQARHRARQRQEIQAEQAQEMIALKADETKSKIEKNKAQALKAVGS